jgi:hypothetical protein
LTTGYTAVDMISYNKKRKAEFFEVQKKLEADSLDAARLAYMTGKATEEQIALVEEAIEREGRIGSASHIFKKPEVNSAIKGENKSPNVTEVAKWPGSVEAQPVATQVAKKTGGGIWSWFSSELKREEQGDNPGSSQERLGYESLSEEDETSGMRNSDLARAVEDKQAYLRAKARMAFEAEKENQKKGGPLDRIGTDTESSEAAPAPKRKGWFW